MPIWVVLALLFIGGAAGAVALAPRGRPPVPPDPVACAVLSALPGGNCGACGNESCYDAALAVASGKAGADVCATGGDETLRRVTDALQEASSETRS